MSWGYKANISCDDARYFCSQEKTRVSLNVETYYDFLDLIKKSRILYNSRSSNYQLCFNLHCMRKMWIQTRFCSAHNREKTHAIFWKFFR